MAAVVRSCVGSALLALSVASCSTSSGGCARNGCVLPIEIPAAQFAQTPHGERISVDVSGTVLSGLFECGGRLTASQTPQRVTLTWARRPLRHGVGSCAAVPLSTHLTSPVGTRSVVDAATGRPVRLLWVADLPAPPRGVAVALESTVSGQPGVERWGLRSGLFASTSRKYRVAVDRAEVVVVEVGAENAQRMWVDWEPDRAAEAALVRAFSPGRSLTVSGNSVGVYRSASAGPFGAALCWTSRNRTVAVLAGTDVGALGRALTFAETLR